MSSISVQAYRAQIEALDLVVSSIKEDGGWTALRFNRDFDAVTLSTPSSTPHYCRIELKYSIDDGLLDDECQGYAEANDHTARMRIAKTVVRFNDGVGTVAFAAEFLAECDYSIRPSLNRYLEIVFDACDAFFKRLRDKAAKAQG